MTAIDGSGTVVSISTAAATLNINFYTSGELLGSSNAFSTFTNTLSGATSAKAKVKALMEGIISGVSTSQAVAHADGTIGFDVKIKDAPVATFTMNGKLYLMNGYDFLVYDGKTWEKVTDNPYIPTLTIARAPSGGGAPNEDFNLIGSGFKDSFSADGTAKVYQLSLTGLDATKLTAKVNNKDLKEGSDFTVDRSKGKVTFSSAPSTGTDNVIITAHKTFSTKPAQITNCTSAVVYGGTNDTRVFISGNDSYRNYIWRSGLYDPSYWPENGFYKIGADAEAVMGFVKQYDYLLIEKERSKWALRYQLSSDGVPSFPINPVNDTVGTIARKSIQLIENNPVSLSRNGVYMTTKTSIRDERDVQSLSHVIDRLLLAEKNLDKATSFDFDHKYWLCVNGRVYIYDYLIKQWWIYDNIHASCFYAIGDTLYFGSDSSGVIYRFMKPNEIGAFADDGDAIYAYWYSKLMTFDVPEIQKLVKHLYMTLAPYNHSSANVYIRTDKKGESHIGMKRCDQLNFLEFDFARFSFVMSSIPQEKSKKMKEKKITHIQFKIENTMIDEGLTITSFNTLYQPQGVVK